MAHIKNFLIPLLIIIMLSSASYAQVYNPNYGTGLNVPNAESSQYIRWTSKSASDVISFQNGTGATLVIQITVDNNLDKTGININNCGTTSHVDSGSTVICVTRDSRSPVYFVTDNPNRAVSGLYVVQLLR